MKLYSISILSLCVMNCRRHHRNISIFYHWFAVTWQRNLISSFMEDKNLFIWQSIPCVLMIWQCKRSGHQQPRPWLVCSTPLLTRRISLYTASVVSLKTALIGWRASDCDASIQLLHIQTNMRSTLLSSTWRPSPTWRKQKIFPFPGTVALWVFYKSREFPAFFRGCGQSYAYRHGTWNSPGSGQFLPE